MRIFLVIKIISSRYANSHLKSSNQQRKSLENLTPETIYTGRTDARYIMKVTKVTNLPVDRFNYVKVETDEGITGVGELHPASGTGGTPFVPRAAVEYCAEYLVGKDPSHIERHWQHMFRRQLFRGGSDMMAAIGAIDIALWDIKGKSLNKPVYELIAVLCEKKCDFTRI